MYQANVPKWFPTAHYAALDDQVTFVAHFHPKVLASIRKMRIEWQVDGVFQRQSSTDTFQYTFKDPRTYVITAELLNTRPENTDVKINFLTYTVTVLDAISIIEIRQRFQYVDPTDLVIGQLPY
jgi:hypothetical protein